MVNLARVLSIVLLIHSQVPAGVIARRFLSNQTISIKMATSKKHLISVRSNTKFAVNYETKNLTPEIELILISIEPKYEAKKDGIHKGNEVNEFRIFSDLDGVNKLIGELQLLVVGMQQYEQLSSGINSLIEQGNEKK